MLQGGSIAPPDLQTIKEHNQQHMPNPVIIIATPQSSATQEIRLYPMTRQCMVFWQSPHYSNHKVRRRDMLRLLVNLDRQGHGSIATWHHERQATQTPRPCERMDQTPQRWQS